MLPGPVIVTRCPNCQGLVSRRTLAYGNTLGAKWWTDGEFRARMLPMTPELIRCVHCTQFAWRDDFEEVDSYESYLGFLAFSEEEDAKKRIESAKAKRAQYENHPYFEEPSAEEIIRFINRSSLLAHKEVHARILAWRRWNDLNRTPKGLRIGLWIEPWTSWTVDPEVHAAVMRAANLFQAAGATVELMSDWFTPEMRTGLIHFFTMRCRVDLASMPPERAALAAPYIQHAAQFASELSPEDTFRAFNRLQELRAATVAATLAYDYVLSPVSPGLPFAADAINSGGEPLQDAHFTSVFNQSEQPAASICCGFSAGGLPIGLQIAGRRFDDLGVLQMAKFFESTRGESNTHFPLL